MLHWQSLGNLRAAPFPAWCLSAEGEAAEEWQNGEEANEFFQLGKGLHNTSLTQKPCPSSRFKELHSSSGFTSQKHCQPKPKWANESNCPPKCQEQMWWKFGRRGFVASLSCWSGEAWSFGMHSLLIMGRLAASNILQVRWQTNLNGFERLWEPQLEVCCSFLLIPVVPDSGCCFLCTYFVHLCTYARSSLSRPRDISRLVQQDQWKPMKACGGLVGDAHGALKA